MVAAKSGRDGGGTKKNGGSSHTTRLGIFLCLLTLAACSHDLHDGNTEASDLDRQAHEAWKAGRQTEAISLEERALATDQQSAQPDASIIMGHIEQLSDYYRTNGDFLTSTIYDKRLLDLRERAFGPDDLRTDKSRASVGFDYLLEGRLAEAEPLLQRSLAFTESHYGSNSFKTAIRLSNVADLYRKEGRFDEAERLQRRALAIVEATDPSPYSIGGTLSALGQIYAAENKNDEAERTFKRAIDVLDRSDSFWRREWDLPTGLIQPQESLVNECFGVVASGGNPVGARWGQWRTQRESNPRGQPRISPASAAVPVIPSGSKCVAARGTACRTFRARYAPPWAASGW